MKWLYAALVGVLGVGCGESEAGQGVGTVTDTQTQPPDSVTPSPDARGSVSDATPTDDVPPAQDTAEPCDGCDAPTGCPDTAAWEAQNLASLRRVGLRRAVAVVAGTLGEPLTLQGSRYAPLTVYTVHYGWTFLVGQTALIPLPLGLPEPVAGARWVAGLSQSHPIPWDSHPTPYWGNVTTLMPEAEAPAEGLAWRRELAPLVGTARIVARDETRVTFELEEPLHGEWPASKLFQDNWYESWGADYPEPSDTLYLVSLAGLAEYPAGGADGAPVTLGSVLDVRPAYDALIAQAKSAPPPEDLGALRATRERLWLSWRIKRAKDVVVGTVTGLASECCTGAGGTYVRYDRKQVLQGEASATFTLGGHAYYGPEKCGDDWLLFPSSWGTGPQMGEPFSCEAFEGPADEPAYYEQVLATPALVADAQSWLAGAPPLLQLHAAGQAKPGAAPEATLPWAELLDAADAFSVASHIALFTVEKVTPDDDGYVVDLDTTWSPWEYEHLVHRKVSLAFECGDPRLLTVGARLLAPVLLLDNPFGGSSADPDAGPNPESGFLLLGALAPEWALTSELQNLLAQRH